MVHRSLRDAVDDLDRHGMLIRIRRPVDPDLEMAEIQRRVYAAGGPALFFERVEGSPFPAASNLFGTLDRARFLFRDTLRRAQEVLTMRGDPTEAIRTPLRHWRAPLTARWALPRQVRDGPVAARKTQISALPAIRSWPDDVGPFITLPQVFTRDPADPDIKRSNLGMYRIQLSGNDYAPDREVGLHYQIHRGIGAHHQRAIARGQRLRVSVFVGGPPAHTFAAVMPLPEGISELIFAGMLAGNRFEWLERDGHVLAADADFCITGTVDPARLLPEGPFGDHLGYYSLRHDFPVLEVDRVWHRADAIWPFTVVGRPPQEDTVFGQLIHELTGPLVPSSIPGLHALNAVDAAGVHPLMLAIGSERYVPWVDTADTAAAKRGRSGPQELLTIANAVLGFGQASLAKYLFIVAKQDAPALDVRDEAAFVQHLLERVDWRRDLHFHTKTTMDTLDYSGTGLNAGSKLVVAAVGPARRALARTLPALRLPRGYGDARLALPGVAVIRGPSHEQQPNVGVLADALDPALVDEVPLVIVVDDAEQAARSLNDLLWVTFTRSNPSHDVHGVAEWTRNKHWGCIGSLIIDARTKAHHAPPLIEDPGITARVDALAARGGPLHGII
jgi:4-hydroxy-3-polyprenylbenzoate decarboxylase